MEALAEASLENVHIGSYRFPLCGISLILHSIPSGVDFHTHL